MGIFTMREHLPISDTHGIVVFRFVGACALYSAQMMRFLSPVTKTFRFNRILVIVALSALSATGVGQLTNAEQPTDCSSYTSVPLPPEAEKVDLPAIFPACASYRSYRGIGRPVNYVAARACAWKERLAQQASLQQNPAQPIAWFVGGSLVLADMYLNGDGVPRNVPLAIRLACESEEGMVMLALPDIEKREQKQGGRKPIELCDYANSTFAMNFCARYEADIGDDRRERHYRSLKASMNPEQQEAFGRLLAAERAYIETHAYEVDQGGTIRGLRTMGSQAILKDLFRTEVTHFERKEWPQLTDKQILQADLELRLEYRKKVLRLRKQTEDEIDEGAVSAAHLVQVERAWEGYRAAWVAFARVRYPSAVPEIRAEVTLDRYRLLKTIDAYQ